MDASDIKVLLAQLARELDAPDGPGSGAVCLDALTVIEAYERMHPPTPGRRE
jgi:hypothetical protein